MNLRPRTPAPFALTGLLVAGLTLANGSAARAQSTPPSGYTAAYFVLDFADGTTTPEYAFQDNYTTGASLTASDLLDQLAAKLTSPAFTQTYTQYSFGRFYTAFSYGMKSQANPPYTSTSPYWGFWVSSDGTNWTQPQTYGASAAPLSSNPWTAFSYGANGGPAPVRPTSFSATILTNAATPEPGAFALLGAGVLPLVGIVARRRKS